MAERQDSHVVEIPAVDDAKAGPQTLFENPLAAVPATEHHPLSEISESPGHLLLLKLWQREEDHLARRIASKEVLLDGLRREAFHLCSLFFAFHGLSLTLLFAASVQVSDLHRPRACADWWVPSGLSLVTSLAIVSAVQARVRAYWRASARLQRERGDARALARCVQELRMRGASFNLSREPQAAARRMKSSSVEVRWRRPLRWCSRNIVTLCLLCFTGLVFPACKFILCG